MSGREELLQELTDVIGEKGCGVSCEEATLYKDEDGWKMMSRGSWRPGIWVNRLQRR